MATLVGRVGPVRGFLVNYCIPVVSVLEGSLVGEQLELPSLAGMVVVILAAVVASHRSK